MTCIGSLLNGFLDVGDEILVLDTGSSDEHFSFLKQQLKTLGQKRGAPSIRLIDGRDLSVPLAPYIEEWLPEYVGKLENDGQYKDLRGILSFAEARQRVLDESKHDLVFWIDTDDVLKEERPGELRRVVEATMVERPQYSALFLVYEYAFDAQGTLTTTLKRERIIRKSDYNWKGRCHETCIPKEGLDVLPVGFCEDLPASIVHTDARKKHKTSDIRNYIIMRNEIEELGENEGPDPRTLFYLANAARGLERHDECIKLYTNFEGMSGSPDDRWTAAYYVANTYMHPDIRRPVDAQDWFFKCIEIKPFEPRGYFGLSRAYLAQERPQQALHWYEVGKKFPEPTRSLHAYDPTHIHYKPHLVAAQALQRIDRARDAVPIVAKALEFKKDKEGEEFEQFIKMCAAGEALAESIEHVGMHVRGGGMNARRLLRRIYEDIPAVPKSLEKNGLGKLEEPDPRDKAPEVVLFCGETAEEWGPLSAKTGIGGSEKMVLLLAPALQKRGYNVTVYASVPFPQRGLDENQVMWRHWSEMDMKRPRHALVVWRGVGHIRLPLPAQNRILWLHDVQNPGVYTPDVIATADLVQFQSEYHTIPLKGVLPKDRVWVARNAIDTDDSNDGVEKDPNKVVFLSCPTRGATTAMEIIRRAQAVNPKINLTVMYGFSPFERKVRNGMDHRHIPDLGRDASVDDFERYFGRLADETGTRVLNRVSFDRVKEELASAGMWLYPTQFPEISCMAAMEVQAHGVIPVATRYAALAETILPEADALCKPIEAPPSGDREEYYKRAAASVVLTAGIAAGDERRHTMASAARKAYNIDDLADQWAEKLGGLDK
jgi:glycosyltransferase involved in cell wall biosynthesis